MEEERHVEINIYEQSQKTVDVYTDGWHFRLGALIETVGDVARTADAVRAPYDVLPAPAREFQTGSSAYGNDGKMVGSMLGLSLMGLVLNSLPSIHGLPLGDNCYTADFD